MQKKWNRPHRSIDDIIRWKNSSVHVLMGDQLQTKFYITVTDKEAADEAIQKEAERSKNELVSALESKGWERGKDLIDLYVPLGPESAPGSGHLESEWLRQLSAILSSPFWNEKSVICMTDELHRFLTVRRWAK